jgi:hypothetical protein
MSHLAFVTINYGRAPLGAPPHVTLTQPSQSQSYFAIDSLSVSTSWCRAHSGTYDQMLFSFRSLMSEVFCLVSFLGALSDEKSGLSFVSLSL